MRSAGLCLRPKLPYELPLSYLFLFWTVWLIQNRMGLASERDGSQTIEYAERDAIAIEISAERQRTGTDLVNEVVAQACRQALAERVLQA